MSRIHIELKEEDKELLRKVARKHYMSMSAFIRKLIRDALDAHKQEQEVSAAAATPEVPTQEQIQHAHSTHEWDCECDLCMVEDEL